MDRHRNGTVIDSILNTFGSLLKKQISICLNGADIVTISRHEDRRRYGIKVPPIFHLPLTCDPKQFRVYEPKVDAFIAKVNIAAERGDLCCAGGERLVRFVSDAKKAQRRTMIYVGRLSDEKNIHLLMDACEKLLSREGIKEKVHFLFIGAGYAASEIEQRFLENATVIGLVPNWLLPDIYNFVRQRHGFFISASDTETYGITHEEAQRCGLPLVAMYKGTRGHFYFPGDLIGEKGIPVPAEKEIRHAVAEIARSDKSFFVTANGLCIPDFSGGVGVALLNDSNDRILAMERLSNTLSLAMYTMINLPVHVLFSMSTNAAKYTQITKLGWDETWKLLSQAIYPNDPATSDLIMARKRHIYRENWQKSEFFSHEDDLTLEN